jgi:hypothetical protein
MLSLSLNCCAALNRFSCFVAIAQARLPPRRPQKLSNGDLNRIPISCWPQRTVVVSRACRRLSESPFSTSPQRTWPTITSNCRVRANPFYYYPYCESEPHSSGAPNEGISGQVLYRVAWCTGPSSSGRRLNLPRTRRSAMEAAATCWATAVRWPRG